MIDNVENLVIDLKSKSVDLRTLNLQNYSADYISWINDSELNQFLEIRHKRQTPENIKDYILSMNSDPNSLFLGMFKPSTQLHIGNIKLGPINWRYRRADIGLIVGDRREWSKGIATSAIKLVTELAFEELNLRRVQAGAYASNLGSIRAFEKVGFSIEGRLKAYWELNGVHEDEVLMGLTNLE